MGSDAELTRYTVLLDGMETWVHDHGAVMRALDKRDKRIAELKRELEARRETMEEIQQILDSRMPSGDRQALIEVTMKQIQKQYPTEANDG